MVKVKLAYIVVALSLPVVMFTYRLYLIPVWCVLLFSAYSHFYLKCPFLYCLYRIPDNFCTFAHI